MSDVKVLSSTVAVIFAITRVVNNYNIRTVCFEQNQTNLIPNRIVFRVFFFEKRTKIKTIPYIPNCYMMLTEHNLLVIATLLVCSWLTINVFMAMVSLMQSCFCVAV